jgi:1,2-diacylglycerol 3-beta-galactosyltransferase
LKPSFSAGPPEDKRAAKVALGLDPDRPVLCVLYGGQGSWRMRDIGLALKDLSPEVQVLFLCGHHRDLAAALEQIDWPFAARVVGFTQDVPRYLGASDIFIGKPGPGSVSEALNYGLHLMLDRRLALPQETPVLAWVRRSGAGTFFRTSKEFRRGIAMLINRVVQGDRPPESRPNRASDEIPAIIAQILERD